MQEWIYQYENYQNTDSEIPLDDILKDSLFYPASGLDAAPIKHLSKEIQSFVYADYSVTEEQFLGNLNFKDYSIVLQRKLDIDTVFDNQFTSWYDSHAKSISQKHVVDVQAPYAYWLIAEKQENIHSDGAALFSLLFLCAEGVTSYQALYSERGIAPKAIAVIQPGTGFGGNWTNFRNPDGDLAKLVFSTKSWPKLMLCGGSGGSRYEKSDWPIFDKQVKVVDTNKGDGFVIFEQ